MKRDWDQEWSPVAGIVSAWLLNYDSTIFPFANFFRHVVFGVETLEALHRSHHCPPNRPLRYTDNLRLRELMQRLPSSSEFYVIYENFVRQLVVRHFGGRLSYSARPKMRVHLAGTESVSRWHRDADITGRPEQINIWLPATPCFSGNTLWVETDYGTESYQPIALKVGQALFFDGALLSHGTVPNHTDCTRVSFDLRFTPSSTSPTAMTVRILGQRLASGFSWERHR